MLRKFAVALIATTMLVAPALAGEAVKSTPATPAVATTPAATSAVSTGTKADTKPFKEVKKANVARRHIAMAKHGKHLTKIAKHRSQVKTAKVAKTVAPSATTASTPSSMPSAATVKSDTAGKTQTIKADKPVKKTMISHRHNGHKLAMVKHGKVKTAKRIGKTKIAKQAGEVKTATHMSKVKTTQGTGNNKANVN